MVVQDTFEVYKAHRNSIPKEVHFLKHSFIFPLHIPLKLKFPPFLCQTTDYRTAMLEVVSDSKDNLSAVGKQTMRRESFYVRPCWPFAWFWKVVWVHIFLKSCHTCTKHVRSIQSRSSADCSGANMSVYGMGLVAKVNSRPSHRRTSKVFGRISKGDARLLPPLWVVFQL